MNTDTKRSTVQRMAVVTAIAVTALLALGSFILSFSALWDIATEIWPQRELSWIAPVIVDGTILQATISLAAAAGDESRRARHFFWFLLTTAAAISIAGNALHAYISETARLDPMVAVIGGTIPPGIFAPLYPRSLSAPQVPTGTRGGAWRGGDCPSRWGAAQPRAGAAYDPYGPWKCGRLSRTGPPPPGNHQRDDRTVHHRAHPVA